MPNFMGPVPGSSNAITQAFQRRGLGIPSGQLNQISGGSPFGQAAQPNMSPGGGPPPPQPPSDTPQLPPAPGQGTPKPPTSEAEIILKAMDQRLKHLSTVEKQKMGPMGGGIGNA